MPAPAGTKRVRGVQIHRPFIYGSEAIPFDPSNKPKDAPTDHTHRWKVFVRGVNGEDISHWLRRVQFKLHETYASSLRTIEQSPFEVEETGWGEFEINIKFHFVPESGEKSANVWHRLLLHPYVGDTEAQKLNRDVIKSVCYEEILFTEPSEQFYEILTGGLQKGKGSKTGKKAAHTADIPEKATKDNVFSREEEFRELDRMGEAIKKVEQLATEEKAKIIELESKVQELEATEGKVNQKKK